MSELRVHLSLSDAEADALNHCMQFAQNADKAVFGMASFLGPLL